MTTLQFSQKDLELFAAASHDVNPLHCSDMHAHSSVFGERAVFGILGVLTCLARLDAPDGQELAELTFNFPGAMLMGVPYGLEFNELADDRVELQLSDGRRTALELSATLRQRSAESTVDGDPGGTVSRTEAADYPVAELVEGQTVQGEYAVPGASMDALSQHLDLGTSCIPRNQAELLAACSYLVGMEIPGRRALFSSGKITFAPLPSDPPPSSNLTYSLRLDRYDARFGLASMTASFARGRHSVGEAHLKAFVRPDATPVNHELMATHLPPSNHLTGHVAVVTGASRGLGARWAAALASQGCTVLGTYSRSTAEIEALADNLSGGPGKLVPVQGDTGMAATGERLRAMILEDYGRLDLLVCNAGLPLRPLWVEPTAAQRVCDYVADALPLVNTPLAFLMDLLDSNRGQLIVISSSAMRSPPAEWPHYVAAKGAIEGLALAASVEYPGTRVFVVRPPRLVTDLTNTPPFGRFGALAPELIAAHVTNLLLEPRPPDAELVLVEDFDLPQESPKS